GSVGGGEPTRPRLKPVEPWPRAPTLPKSPGLSSRKPTCSPTFSRAAGGGSPPNGSPSTALSPAAPAPARGRAGPMSTATAASRDGHGQSYHLGQGQVSAPRARGSPGGAPSCPSWGRAIPGSLGPAPPIARGSKSLADPKP